MGGVHVITCAECKMHVVPFAALFLHARSSAIKALAFFLLRNAWYTKNRRLSLEMNQIDDRFLSPACGHLKMAPFKKRHFAFSPQMRRWSKQASWWRHGKCCFQSRSATDNTFITKSMNWMQTWRAAQHPIKRTLHVSVLQVVYNAPLGHFWFCGGILYQGLITLIKLMESLS